MSPEENNTVDTDQGAPPPAEEGKASNAEAARHRVRARQAEEERDLLAKRLEALQTAELHRIAADRLADPTDLGVFGVTLADVIDEETGLVDQGRVDSVVGDLLEKRPRLARDYAPDAVDFDAGARKTLSRPTASWSGVLSGTQR